MEQNRAPTEDSKQRGAKKDSMKVELRAHPKLQTSLTLADLPVGNKAVGDTHTHM